MYTFIIYRGKSKNQSLLYKYDNPYLIEIILPNKDFGKIIILVKNITYSYINKYLYKYLFYI